MFISVQYLHDQLGVDESIARFFVDRKVPTDNAFWAKRLLYIAWGNGFVSIPVYYDILFRVGVPVTELLAEPHVEFMQRIMHFAIQVERKQLGYLEHLESIEALLKDRPRNPLFALELRSYLRQEVLSPQGRLGLRIPALNRADVFLYVLCDLPMSEAQTAAAVRYWYALHPSYLLMDDIYDYQLDKQNQEENAVVELGDGKTGFAAAFTILDENIKTLKEINPVLGHSMEEQMEGLHDLIV